MPVVYKKPGWYVAVCNKTNFDGHYIKIFEFPAVGRVGCGREGEKYEDMEASWFFLNRVDFTACIEAVYPLEIFQPIIEAIDEEFLERFEHPRRGDDGQHRPSRRGTTSKPLRTAHAFSPDEWS